MTFVNENNIIVYALEKIIPFARNNLYIPVAQHAWWRPSIIGLQQGLVIHIDNLNLRTEKSKRLAVLVNTDILNRHPDRVIRIQVAIDSSSEYEAEKPETLDNDTHDRILENCEEYLRQSKLQMKKITRRSLQISTGLSKKMIWRTVKNHHTETEGIDTSELKHRKTAAESQQCAWPQDRNGGHKILDSFRSKQIQEGTAPFTN